MARKMLLLKAALVLLIFTFIAVPDSFAAKERREQPRMKASRIFGARLAQRDLIGDHIFWVRSVVLATAHNDKDAAKAYEEKVVDNDKAIAASIAPFYGKEASDKLFNLFAGHYGAIKDYMNASFAGDNDGKNAAMDKMKGNAEEIAAFLSGVNPNWPNPAVTPLLLAHIGHHAAQIDAVAAKDFNAEAGTWAEMKKNAFAIADALVDGLAKQFPQKF